MRYLCVMVLALAGCAAGPGPAPAKPQPAGKPPAAPAGVGLPAPVFVGNWPASIRQEALRQIAMLPAPQRANLPRFALATAAEVKSKVGSEAMGYYDVATRTCYARRDLPQYFRDFFLHEPGHDWFLCGADPKYPGRPKFMTQAQRNEWHRWCQSPTGRIDPRTGKPRVYYRTGKPELGWHTLPRYSDDDRECFAKTHEEFACAFNAALFPGGVHPRYGRLDPFALARLKQDLVGPK